MKTPENLQAAFAGESQANRKYLAFARKAEQDGLPQVARLFRAAAEAETIHAHAHFRVLQGVKTTAENLAAAMAGEAHEFRSMYPVFVAEAERENQAAALTSFKYAMAVEQTHHDLYAKALESVKSAAISRPPRSTCAASAVTPSSATPPTSARYAARRGRSSRR